MKPLRLLLVEDDEVDRAAVKRALKSARIEADIAEVDDGDAALDTLTSGAFDCVLLDYRLPKSDGLALLQRARANGLCVPFIVLTGQGDEELAAEMMRAGASDYLAKSFVTPDRLERSIRHALRIAQAESERTLLLASEKAAREEAQAANRAKDEFMATLSHELRTPLNAILGWAHLLRDAKLDAAHTVRAVDAVVRNAEAQARLIEDLLDVSRIATGKLDLDFAEVQLGALVDSLVDSFQPDAAAREITLTCVADGTAEVQGDARRLQQIVGNLISNAIKFTPSGGRVDIALSRRASRAVITVRDTGIGLDAAFIPHAFERFQQAETGSTRRHGGLGLGLNIVRHLAGLHGGTVTAESEGHGRGATFTVSLPLVATARPPQADRTGRAGTTRLTHLYALCVDDDQDSLNLVAAVLENSGARVTAVRSAAEALRAIAAERPDVLISDLAMPHEDGYSLIRAIRSSPDATVQRIPALALTAYAGAGDLARTMEAGFQAHLAKPYSPDDLTSAVAALKAPLTKT